MVTAEIIGLADTALLLFLVCRLLARGLAPEYGIFFLYLAFEATSAVASEVIIWGWGIDSPLYWRHYFIYSSLTPGLQIWILLDLAGRLFRAGREGSRAIWMLAVIGLFLGFPLLVSVRFFNIEGWYRFQAATLAYQMVLALLLYIYLLERRDINPGRNLRGILGGVALMVGCQAFNFFGYSQDRIPFEVFQLGVPAIYGVALLIFAFSLRTHDSVSVVPERRTLNLGLQRSLRMMIDLIQPR